MFATNNVVHCDNLFGRNNQDVLYVPIEAETSTKVPSYKHTAYEASGGAATLSRGDNVNGISHSQVMNKVTNCVSF